MTPELYEAAGCRVAGQLQGVVTLAAVDRARNAVPLRNLDHVVTGAALDRVTGTREDSVIAGTAVNQISAPLAFQRVVAVAAVDLVVAGTAIDVVVAGTTFRLSSPL